MHFRQKIRRENTTWETKTEMGHSGSYELVMNLEGPCINNRNCLGQLSEYQLLKKLGAP
jgi:hypothetical protein